jgi:5'-3' exonuclease
MTTITIDILDDKALNLIKDLELLKIIRVRKDKKVVKSTSENLIAKYKGAMVTQPVADVDKQLNDLRNEWE